MSALAPDRRCIANAFDDARGRLRALRHVLGALGDFPGGVALTLHRMSHSIGDRLDLPDRVGNAVDRLHRPPGRSWIAEICVEISSVARAVWVASALTSEATTAKPLPASPAARPRWWRSAPAGWSGPRFVDQLNDVADLLCGGGKLAHRLARAIGLIHGIARDVARTARLAEDLGYRGAQFLGRLGDHVRFAMGRAGSCPRRCWRRSRIDAPDESWLPPTWRPARTWR